ncbi:group III truncated hemoglobin [Arachidicoccus terrestris]|uniref:group III truncated hemoglobin n=1 Tax=Arachidicoccus terrestris TaxID=2875539 RepID=UPI001CC51466|nr:group III truncated hemoglobin [Arachidicoccus terrestris]UAY55129.1 group III truncated hemoglobin [Arachidicoccus terrestris]
MEHKKDILTLEDCKVLVDNFYDKVRKDPLIGPIFDGIIRDKWPEHLEKMYRFWQTVLLEDHTYFGSPFPPHANLPVDWHHFEKWLELFNQTIDEHFTGDKATEARWRANKMAEMFNFKIQYYKNNQARPLF